MGWRISLFSIANALFSDSIDRTFHGKWGYWFWKYDGCLWYSASMGARSYLAGLFYQNSFIFSVKTLQTPCTREVRVSFLIVCQMTRNSFYFDWEREQVVEYTANYLLIINVMRERHRTGKSLKRSVWKGTFLSTIFSPSSNIATSILKSSSMLHHAMKHQWNNNNIPILGNCHFSENIGRRDSNSLQKSVKIRIIACVFLFFWGASFFQITSFLFLFFLYIEAHTSLSSAGHLYSLSHIREFEL